MLAIQIISATALSVMCFMSWKGYVRESRRLRALQEKAKLGDIIHRRIDVVIRDRQNLIDTALKTGIFDTHADSLLREEDKEIDKLIYKYERM